MSDEPLPHNPDAERAVLGSVLLGGVNVWLRLPPDLGAHHFLNENNAAIFAAMVEIYDAKEPLDTLTVKARLMGIKRGSVSLLEAIGGASYVSSLTDMVPDVANVERYAGIVVELWQRRRLIAVGHKLAQDAAEAGAIAADVTAGVLQALGPLATREEEQARPVIEWLDEAYETMEELKRGNRAPFFTSGWFALDDHKVFSPVFAVTGAPSKAGKTALMLALGKGLAEHDTPVAFFSLESRPLAAMLRLTSAETGIEHKRMRDWRTFSRDDYDRVAQAKARFAKLPMHLSRGPRVAEDIINEMRRLRAMHGVRAFFVDYLQLVEIRRSSGKREEELTKIAKMFQDAAGDMDVHLHAMSQLGDDRTPGARLRIRDLAFSRFIGKSARIVLLMQRRRKEDPGAMFEEGRDKGHGVPVCHVDVQIEANNEERTNDFPAHFDEVTQRFTEGDCEANDCRTLRGTTPATKPLFAAGG